MSYNGSGTFVRLYNWVNDRNANVKIMASRMDAEMDGFATGLSTCITKDGQTTITANIPMSNFKFTSIGDSTARTQYPSTGQIQDGGLVYVGSISGTNTITGSLSPAITAYVTGAYYAFKVGTTNTASTTINLNSVGAKTIKNMEGNSLSGGELVAGNLAVLYYDGTNMQLVSAVPREIQYNAQIGTTYTVVASDHAKIITLSNASAITLTIPQQSTTTLRQGFWCIIRQIGAGQVTVAKQGSDTINSIGSATKLRAQYSEARIDLQTAGSPNTWGLFGDISS